MAGDDELTTLEAEIAQQRETLADLRRQLGDQSDGTTDAAESAAALSSIEEQEALLGALESRRDRLVQGSS